MILTIYCIAAYIIAIIYIRYDTDVSIPEKSWHAYHSAIFWFAPCTLPGVAFMMILPLLMHFVLDIPRWIVEAGRPKDYYTYLQLKELARRRDAQAQPPTPPTAPPPGGQS